MIGGNSARRTMIDIKVMTGGTGIGRKMAQAWRLTTTSMEEANHAILGRNEECPEAVEEEDGEGSVATMEEDETEDREADRDTSESIRSVRRGMATTKMFVDNHIFSLSKKS
jgi:hypothetical protein